jgi:hypothetical protein
MPPNDQNADQDRLTAYRAMFAAAAPLMQQQATKDGVQIKIGGPDLVYALKGHLTSWFPTLLNDPAIYPYIGFISYHVYIKGSSFNGGRNSLIANEQDPALGVTAQYEQIASIVHKGKQPNAKNTPIYIDEYSMSTCDPAQCQNNQTFSPLMNGLFVMDYLNAVRDIHSPYGPASAVPAGLAFYSWDIPLHNLCMFGVYDAEMDCGVQEYPRIQPYPDYQTLHVYLQNPGTVPVTQANVYTLAFNQNNPGSSISSARVKLVPVTGGGFMATVNLPADTMIGISIGAQ